MPPPPAAKATGNKARLIVLELTPAGGVEPSVAGALTEAVTTEVASRGLFEVLSSKEMQTMLGMERQRQVMGCSANSSSCLTELADALGARFVMRGSIAKLGPAYQLTLETLDSLRAVSIGRATRIASDLATLRGQIPYAVAEAAEIPLPPPPSHVLPYSLMTGGGLVFLGGGLVAFNAFTQEGAIGRELSNGANNPNALQSLAAYQNSEASIVQQKWIGAALLAAGVVIVGVGIFINPSEGTSGAKVALIPTGNGAMLAGSFP